MIPILLLTGFLGSGKTTFINWLLEKHPQTKVSVVLNEFGDTNLESQFVKHHTEEIVELANGCMCCVAKSDIPRVVRYILEHSPQTEYILIEASGLSDPDPVREALQAPPVSDQTYLESTLCMIDVLNYEAMRADHAIISAQIADADLVVLTKVQLASEEQTARVQSLIQGLAADIRIIPFTTDLPPEIFLTKEPASDGIDASDVGHVSRVEPTKAEHHHLHDSHIVYFYETKDLMLLEKLQAVIKELPIGIIRVKGVVRFRSPDGVTRAASVQRVGAHFTIEDHAGGEPLVQSSILFIGKDFDQAALAVKLHDCRDMSSIV